VAHPTQKEIRFLILECSQGAGDCVFRPALGIGLLGILHEAFKRGGQRVSQLRKLKLANQVRPFPHDEVVAIAQGFLQASNLL
jgi:hypothetical protein